MTDKEKLKLIDGMICDFWQYNDSTEGANGALTMLDVITSVIEFETENASEVDEPSDNA